MEKIKEFCRKMKLNGKIERAFIAYCKASVGEYFNVSENVGATGLLDKFNEEEVKKLWEKFKRDMRLS